MRFERIRSGIGKLDELLDNIRLGDNVVMQVTGLDDFRFLSGSMVRQAVADGRNINYIRFAEHEPILEPQDGLKIHRLSPDQGFEPFTVQVQKIIEKEGNEAFYIFDCLSDLQVSWSTDLMMGNFFCVTCPYLFELDTVAYFPILRGHHDYATIARIQETTQIFLDIYSNNRETYLHPIKVWNRYSAEMYLPYKLNSECGFETLINSTDLADYYRSIHMEQTDYAEQNMDSYERFFRKAKEAYYEGTIDDETLTKISRSMMTHDPKMSKMIRNEFSPEDLFFIKTKIIGTGTIGGKACGMLLARKMIENYLPADAKFNEPHDSFYIGTDVFYSYIVDNGLWSLRIAQRKEENYFKLAEKLSMSILHGQFSQQVRDQFRRMLEYFGQIPIIVRSSSFLEDGFGNAFAGKYESIFCPNGFDPETRLEAFLNAVRRVYASTMDQSALEYRRKRGMAETEEQMAILVQRVSGTKFGDYYMPCAAGVGFSYSIYRWSDELSSDAGLLRLVAGLGTRAVNRTASDYPRLVNLDKPESTVLVTEEEKHRFSQRFMDVINTKTNMLEEVSVYDAIPLFPKWYTDLVCEHDSAAENLLEERGRFQPVMFVSCAGIVQNRELMQLMKDILSMLAQHYRTPVDIEYTMNFEPEGAFSINILQCRPLCVWQSSARQSIPKIRKEDILFKVHRTFMGNTAKTGIDVIVFIDSVKYHNMPYNSKSTIVSLIGKINQYYSGSGRKLMLISPGRIGTSSPELGITAAFSDISNFNVICEYEDEKIGFIPELSYGSHMFQDLVESDMIYVAIMDKRNNNIFNRDFLSDRESVLYNILPAVSDHSDIVRVYETDPDAQLSVYMDLMNGTAICGKESNKKEICNI
ncbi:MAG: PEP/pyruvate-binding domain-containing protein [Clostridia bacterium]